MVESSKPMLECLVIRSKCRSSSELHAEKMGCAKVIQNCSVNPFTTNKLYILVNIISEEYCLSPFGTEAPTCGAVASEFLSMSDTSTTILTWRIYARIFELTDCPNKPSMAVTSVSKIHNTTSLKYMNVQTPCSISSW